MSLPRATEARVLTPAGRGAIAVVEVSGPQAVAIVASQFVGSAPLGGAPLDAIRFGRWRRPDGAPGEEVVLVRTATDRVEVHCHGGRAAPAAVLRSLVTAGACEPPATASAETPSREALRWLAEAATERAAAVLLDQASGALERAVGALLAAINDPPAALAAIEALLRHERLALRLVTPWRVVVAGPPNVGKSALVNALLGYERAIVFDRPGTTRDVVATATAIAGWPVTLEDTAGVRRSDDPLEAAGVALARERLAQADIVLLVSEAATYLLPPAESPRSDVIAAVATCAAVLDIASKADLAPPGWAPPEGVLATSARRGEGIDALLDAIHRAMGVATPAPGEAVPLGAWRYDRLRAAHRALVAGDPSRAEAAVRALLADDRS